MITFRGDNHMGKEKGMFLQEMTNEGSNLPQTYNPHEQRTLKNPTT